MAKTAAARRPLERQVAYRTVGEAGQPTRWGFGHVTKTNAAGNYVDRPSDELILVYPIRGTGRFIDGRGREHRVAAGDALLHLPDQTHSLLVDPDGRWIEYWLVADVSFAQSMLALRVIDEARPIVRAGVQPTLIDRFERIAHDLRAMHDDDVDRIAVQYHELLVELNHLERGGGSDSSDRAMVQRACRRLAEDFDRRIALPELAGALNVSYERFRKVFREHVGLSPGEYRIRRRIDRARELIVQQRLSNKQIARQLGYADPFAFSKQFKQVVGQPPAAFRKQTG